MKLFPNQGYTTSDAARSALRKDRFALLSPGALVGAEELGQIRSQVFGLPLEADAPRVHTDRERSTDRVHYERNADGSVVLREAVPNTPDPTRFAIDYYHNHTEPRSYSRFNSLAIPALAQLLPRWLDLIPEEERPERGAIDLRAFRTRTNVVMTRHQDGDVNTRHQGGIVDWVSSLVVTKHGSGAYTELSIDKEGVLLVARVDVGEGALVISQDQAFFHFVTPLESTVAFPAPVREALIITHRSPEREERS